MVSWTTQKTWALSEKVATHDFNTYIRDAETYLNTRNGIRVRSTIQQDTETGVWAKVDFATALATVDWQNGSILSQTSNSTVFTPGTAGQWLVMCVAEFDNNGTGSIRAVRVRFNDSSSGKTKFSHTPPSSGVNTFVSGIAVVTLTATDTFQVEVYQDSGGDLGLITCRLIARYLGNNGSATVTWTTPRTWSNAGDTNIGFALLNTHIRDDFDFLYKGISAKLWKIVNQSLINNTWTVLTWAAANASVDWNGNAIWASANPSRITPGKAGKWLIVVQVAWANSGAGYRGVRVKFNGNSATVAPLGYIEGGTSAQIPTSTIAAAQVFDLTATDYFEIEAIQNSGGALNVLSSAQALNANTTMAAIWLGDGDNPAWTTPATWTVGQIVADTNMNTQLRDNLGYLYAPSGAKLRLTADQAVPTSGTEKVVTFTSGAPAADWNYNGVWTGVDDFLKADVAGKWMVWATIVYAANGTGYRSLRWRVTTASGTVTYVAIQMPTVTTAAIPTVVSAAEEFNLAVGDVVELVALQTSGGSLNILGAGSTLLNPLTVFGMTWMGS